MKTPVNQPTVEKPLKYYSAVIRAFREEMRRDENELWRGRTVGGIFAQTRGLHKEFGADRVRDTPIAEAGFTSSRSERNDGSKANCRDRFRGFYNGVYGPNSEPSCEATIHARWTG